MIDDAVRSLEYQSLLSMGRTWPNPSVAALLICTYENGAVDYFAGATDVPGRRHAEIAALDEYDRSGRKAKKALLLVTLEPCSVTGRTPPCTERICRYPEIRTVVVFAKDPSLHESGIKKLNACGKKIIDLSGKRKFAEVFLSGFSGRLQNKGPRLHLKAAVTSDGMMGVKGSRIQISSPSSAFFSMLLRSKLDAVVAGPGTVSSDLPGLDLRLDECQDSGDFSKTAGDDLFTESLMKNREKIATLCYGKEYEPLRIFILGNSFPEQDAFLQKQKAVSERTGRKPVFFFAGKSRSQWPDTIHGEELPSLDSENFGSIFRNKLAELGLNEVLVEGGRGLFLALEQEITDRDRIYLIRSQKPLRSEFSPGSSVSLPGYFSKRPAKAEYKLENDTLTVS